MKKYVRRPAFTPLWVQPHSLQEVFRRYLPAKRTLLPWLVRLAPVLEVDEEIELRPLQHEDAETLFELIENNREHLRTWLGWVNKVRTLSHSRDFINYANYDTIYSGKWVYSIWYRGQLAGLMDFNEASRELRQVSLGYWLGADFQGKGIITRVCQRCLAFAFNEKHVDKIHIKCATDNVRSQAVALRLRMGWEGIEHDSGTLNGRSVDMIVYGITRGEWRRMQH
ncbi:MAG: GNAT family protein [Bacteroidia bacterium]|nr:GNAT family protein [Bacteroidia bacterium]